MEFGQCYYRLLSNKVLSTTWLAVITEGKLEDRKSRQVILFSQSPLLSDSSGETHYEYPHYSMIPFLGGDFNTQARIPSTKPTASSSSMLPAGIRHFLAYSARSFYLFHAFLFTICLSR